MNDIYRLDRTKSNGYKNLVISPRAKEIARILGANDGITPGSIIDRLLENEGNRRKVAMNSLNAPFKPPVRVK